MHESQQIAAEHRDLAAHAHRTGAQHHGKEDHLTGHEISRQALEHSNQAYLHAPREHQKSRAGHTADGAAYEPEHEEIAALAYALWETRSCPQGSPDEDWFHAVEELRLAH